MRASKLLISDTIQRVADPIQSRTVDELFMMDLERGNYHVVAGVGPEIWTLLEQHIQIEHIIQRLLETYDVEPGKCETETLNFLDKLMANRLIRLVSSPAAS